jgi:hypothetical protein
MAYAIRSDNGRVFLSVGNSDAKHLMDILPGHFQQKTFTNTVKKTVFVVDCDCQITYGNATICFKEKDYFFPM